LDCFFVPRSLNDVKTVNPPSIPFRSSLFPLFPCNLERVFLFLRVLNTFLWSPPAHIRPLPGISDTTNVLIFFSPSLLLVGPQRIHYGYLTYAFPFFFPHDETVCSTAFLQNLSSIHYLLMALQCHLYSRYIPPPPPACLLFSKSFISPSMTEPTKNHWCGISDVEAQYLSDFCPPLLLQDFFFLRFLFPSQP